MKIALCVIKAAGQAPIGIAAWAIDRMQAPAPGRVQHG